VEQHERRRTSVVAGDADERGPAVLEVHVAPPRYRSEWSVDQGRSGTHSIGLPAAVKSETELVARRGYLAQIDAGLHIDTQSEAGELVIRLVGELDLAASAAFGDAVERAMTSSSRVIVDAADLTFIDSSGVNALVRAQRRASEAAVELVVRAPDRRVRTVLEITGVDALLAIEP
jgi:anti-sigma B factor antagonist